MPEGTIFTFCAVQFLDLVPFHMGVLFYDHLAYTVPIVDSEVFFAEIDEYYSYLSPIVCIDSAGTVDDRESVTQGQTGPGPYLAFISGGKLDVKTCAYESPLHRF